MAETTTLMPIGQFSSLSRLSVRMLRHYDEHGVLVPAEVDPWSGHRRYSPAQLADAAAIRDLRDVGFGVSAIAALLASRGTAAWDRALELQRAALAADLSAARARLSLIDRMLEQGEPPMSITIERATVPAMTVVALRGTVPAYSDEGRLWQELMPALARQGVQPAGPCGVIEHDDEYVESDPDLSVFVPVAPGTTVAGPMTVHDLPARDCVVARVTGPYDQISRAHDLINEHVAAENLSFATGDNVAAKAFNRYLTTPEDVPAEQLVTEVCVPLA